MFGVDTSSTDCAQEKHPHERHITPFRSYLVLSATNLPRAAVARSARWRYISNPRCSNKRMHIATHSSFRPASSKRCASSIESGAVTALIASDPGGTEIIGLTAIAAAAVLTGAGGRVKSKGSA